MSLKTPTPILLDVNSLEAARKLACGISICGGIRCEDCTFSEDNIDQLDKELVVRFVGGHIVPNLEEKLAKASTDRYNLGQFVNIAMFPHKYRTVEAIKHVRQSHTPYLDLRESRQIVDKWKEDNL